MRVYARVAWHGAGHSMHSTSISSCARRSRHERCSGAWQQGLPRLTGWFAGRRKWTSPWSVCRTQEKPHSSEYCRYVRTLEAASVGMGTLLRVLAIFFLIPRTSALIPSSLTVCHTRLLTKGCFVLKPGWRVHDRVSVLPLFCTPLSFRPSPLFPSTALLFFPRPIPAPH